MKSGWNFFCVYLFIFYAKFIILIVIIENGMRESQNDPERCMDAIFTSFYMSILTICEFYSIVKFCISLQIEGLIQIVPLKLYRYLTIFGSFISLNILFFRLLYLALDLAIISYFFMVKDTTFANVFYKYNKILGAEIKVRNAFIVSEY